jgi:hypothetical protein
MSVFAEVITSFRRPKSRRYSIFNPAGAKAKAYQVRQVRAVILHYKLAGEADEQ